MRNGWRSFSLIEWVRAFLGKAPVPEIGTKVFHPDYGDGLVVQIVVSGFIRRVVVDFGYSKPELPVSELVIKKKTQKDSESNFEASEPATRIDQTPAVIPAILPQPDFTDQADPLELAETETVVVHDPLEELPDETQPQRETPEIAGTITSAVERSSEPVATHFEAATPDLEHSVDFSKCEPVHTTTTEATSDDALSRLIEARKGLMALRLGQVLESKVMELSVGTSGLESQLREAVSTAIDGKTVFLLIDAAWGAGKTHALTMLQALARQKRMAVASVVMDGVSASLTSPMELLGEVMSSVRFSDDPMSCDLSYQLSRARSQNLMSYLERQGASFIPATLSCLPVEAFEDHEVIDTVCDFLSLKKTATDANRELQRLSCSGKLKSLKASKVEEMADRFANLLVEWSIFASAMGCNGLLLVLDELDVEYSHTFSGSAINRDLRRRRSRLLEKLSVLEKAPLVVAFAAAPGAYDELEENDPVMDIKNRFGSRIKHLTIQAPGKDDFRLLLDRLLNLYAEAYGIDRACFDSNMADDLFDELFLDYQRDPNAVIRRFVRSAIERMDVYFLHDRRSLITTSDLAGGNIL